MNGTSQVEDFTTPPELLTGVGWDVGSTSIVAHITVPDAQTDFVGVDVLDGTNTAVRRVEVAAPATFAANTIVDVTLGQLTGNTSYRVQAYAWETSLGNLP
jgi:hypothetical protein